MIIELPRRVEGLVVHAGEGTWALSAPGSNATVLTNRVGWRIMDLADGSHSVAQIVEALAAEFRGADSARLRNHIAAFLEDGVKKGLIVAPETPPALVSPVRATGSPALPVLAARPTSAAADEQREQTRKFHPDVYWYLTFRCNLACTHCSVHSSPWVDTSADLKTADCLDVVTQLAEMNVSTAMLSGGEALIRPDAVTILAALAEREIYVGLESNGIKFDAAFIELAKDMQRRGLINITVSLDGGTEATNAVLRGAHAFDRTLRGLRLLKQHGIEFDVQCVLNRENYHTIPDLYALARELTPGRLLWSPLNASGRGSDLVRKIGLRYEDIVAVMQLVGEHKQGFTGITLIKLPPAMVPPKYLIEVYKGKDVGCSTSCKFPLLGVLPNGDITVCAVSRNDESLCFGNVRSTRLKDAWERARMDLLRDRYVSSDELQGICADCVWKYNCKGSCRAMAYEEGGDFFSPFPVCQDAAERGVFPDVYRISKRGDAPLPLGASPLPH
jgi:radical SAM protein with 4Fe4S-binding SPASM domain